MLISGVAFRFAKSLMLFAVEKNELENVIVDIRLVHATCKQSRELRLMLESPVIKGDKKRKIFKEVFEKHIGKMCLTYFDIIFRRNRENMIYDITTSFIEQYKKYNHIHVVAVETASPLNAENRNEVLKYLKKRSSDEVELVEKVNEELLGGIIIKMDNLQIDASIRNYLNKLKMEFSKDMYSVKL